MRGMFIAVAELIYEPSQCGQTHGLIKKQAYGYSLIPSSPSPSSSSSPFLSLQPPTPLPPHLPSFIFELSFSHLLLILLLFRRHLWQYFTSPFFIYYITNYHIYRNHLTRIICNYIILEKKESFSFGFNNEKKNKGFFFCWSKEATSFNAKRYSFSYLFLEASRKENRFSKFPKKKRN